jgi:hypothetical protein
LDELLPLLLLLPLSFFAITGFASVIDDTKIVTALAMVTINIIFDVNIDSEKKRCLIIYISF